MKTTPSSSSRVSALARSARCRAASRAARSSASTRFGSLPSARALQDAGERAEGAADHLRLRRRVRAAAATRSSGSGGIGDHRGLAELVGRELHEPERRGIRGDERAQPVGPVEVGPLGVQHRDRLALGGDLLPQVGDPVQRLLGRIVHPVGPGGADHHQHRRRQSVRSTSFIVSRLQRQRRQPEGARVDRARRARPAAGRRAAWPSAPAGWPRAPPRPARSPCASRARSAAPRPPLSGACRLRARRRAGAELQEALDDAVLERVEGDDREPAAGRERRLGGGEAARELAELVVDRDPERLEAARRRVRLAGLRPRQQPLDQRRRAAASSRTALAARSATIARAMRRDARSSP